MEMYGTSSYAASGVPSGTITVDRPDLGEQQANDLKARWMAAFTGTREPAVLPRSITFTPIAFSPTDMSYIEARKLGATEVCWMFGVHPMMIGAPAGTAMTYGNVESVSAAFARDSLTGWTSRVEQGLTKWVPISSIVRYDYGGMLRGTTLERYQAHEIGLRIGLETLNEARDLEHRTRFDDPLADEPAPLQHKPEPPKPVVLQPDGTPAPPIDAKTGEPQLALIKGGSQ
jgi:HK97 family phage portal protein